MHTRMASASVSGIGRILGHAAIAIALLGVAHAALADEVAAGQPSGAAMRMYRDPDSGRIGVPPPAALVGGSAPARPSPVEPLVSEPVAVPAGGVKIDLHGRFQAAVRRHAGGSGPAAHECVQAEGAAHE